MDNPQKLFNHVSLCTGYGGLDLGIGAACKAMGFSLRTLLYVEREAYAAAILASRIEENRLCAAPIFPDVSRLSEIAPMLAGKYDILSGGFPCQPFSLAGLRDGENDPRHLWPYIRDFAATTNPGLVFLENVPGIISAKTDDPKEPVLLRVLRDLERIGYTAKWGIYGAFEGGSPQFRGRVFILAHAASIGCKRRKVSQLDEYKRRLSAGQLFKHQFPAMQGCPPKVGEPPKILEDANSLKAGSAKPRGIAKAKGQTRPPKVGHLDARLSGSIEGNGKPRVAGDVDGAARGLDTSKRKFSRGRNWENRGRMIGNGVVPQAVAVAFLDLWNKLGLNVE